MRYISTRGKAPALSFEDAVIAGLASDGGLYVPEEIPHFSKDEIIDMQSLSYTELMFKIIAPFVDGEIEDSVLKKIIKESYSEFRHRDIAPVKKIDNNEYLLELFHGPTMAFKDFALQFLGRIFDYVLKKRNEKAVIVGATSGDTGSAAIEGCRHSDNVRMFIMHPHNRVSDVQRKQMTTVLADNVHNIALEGNFDDCQHIVKELFADQSFLQGEKLVAVNSINWCRIMAQIVYYFYSALKLGAPKEEIIYSVPTGNFGDIFAGFMAKKMGLPIRQLIVATNQNDILHRFFEENDYSRSELVKTLSPSMDIQVSSNFERLLFYIYDCDGAKINQIMNDFKAGKGISIDTDKLNEIKQLFSSFCVSDELTCQTIRKVYDASGEIIDPHTAIGVKASRCRKVSNDITTVILATAHPAKFPQAIAQSDVPEPTLPKSFAGLMEKEERFTVIANDIEQVKAFINRHTAA